MIGEDFGELTGEELVRLVGALGRHRYVASRLHLVHAFAIDAATATDEPDPALADAKSWAGRVLGSRGAIDLASKDERLFRKVSDAELVAVLGAFWTPGTRADQAREKLLEHLQTIDATFDEAALPFDEEREEELFPVLVDAGWELLPLGKLDRQRHAGAINAFADEFSYEVAKFEEENAVPPIVGLHELPLCGAIELCAAFGAAAPEHEPAPRTRAPFVVWMQGNEIYLDYVRRGIVRAAKLEGMEAPTGT
jgi:hypothetical protein